MMTQRHSRARLQLAVSLLGLLSLATACSEKGPTAEIRASRIASRPTRPVLPGAPAAQRFGGMGMGAPSRSASDDMASLFAYDLPPGWKVLEPTRERMVNLQPGGDPAASCALSFLPGSAGGLEANVNRWRAQIGAPALSSAEVAGLPTHPLLGRDATLVDVEGEYRGMGEGEVLSDQRLLGLIVCEEGGSLFLKYTGPSQRLAADRALFLDFAASLRLAEGHAAPEPEHDHDHAAEMAAGTDPHGAPGATGDAGGTLRWKAPEGWRQQGPRAMREVTFVPEDHPEVECYIARLGGDGGGLMMNLNRWRGQFGGAALTPAEYEALPRLTMLGQEVAVLEVTGSFTGMDGESSDGQGLLAVACIRPQDSLFVKMVGPAASVHELRGEFEAFLRSLEEL